jgi:hypothetical protein
MTNNIMNEGALLMALFFMASGAVHAWLFVYGLSAVSTVICYISHLLLVTVSEQNVLSGLVCFRATCISV